MQKSKKSTISFQRYWCSYNPGILLGKRSLWSINWNLVHQIDEKILSFTWKSITLPFWIIFNMAMPPRLPKGTSGKSKQVWLCLGKPEHIQSKVTVSNATFPWWIYSWKQSKIMIHSFKKISQEYFGLRIVKQNFPRFGVCSKKIELRSFSLGHFQRKIKTKYYENSRKLHLRPFLLILAQHEFLQNIHFCHLFCIWTPITVQYFSKKLMNRFQEKLVKVIRPYGRTSMNS